MPSGFFPGKADKVNEWIAALRSGKVTPEVFRGHMTSLGYSPKFFGGKLSIPGEQFRAVARQVEQARASGASSTWNDLLTVPVNEINNIRENQARATISEPPMELAGPRTRAECIRVRSQQEERVANHSEGKRRRKKEI